MTEQMRRVAHDLAGYARLERVLAAVCALTPLVLITVDSGPIRASISAYYDMDQNQWYYFLLTVAAMLFMVNGVIKNQNAYNTVLGVLLAGVILFNQDDVTWLHVAFAGAFFIGNALVIAFFSRGSTPLRASLIGVLLVALGAFVIFDAVTLFWLEWASLLVIAVHYILDSLAGVPYRAVE